MPRLALLRAFRREDFGRATAPRALVAALLGLAVVAPAASVAADEPPLVTVSAQCDRASEPGRVRCGVEVRPTKDEKIAWADVSVVKVPALCTLLRGRTGPLEATAREASGYRFALALVARSTQKSELELRVRAVVCSDNKGCRTVTVSPTTDVVVGN